MSVADLIRALQEIPDGLEVRLCTSNDEAILKDVSLELRADFTRGGNRTVCCLWSLSEEQADV